MKLMRTTPAIVVAVLAQISLAGCGGGSGGSAIVPRPYPPDAPRPPSVEPEAGEQSAQRITISFGRTKTDHYPLNAVQCDQSGKCWEMREEESDIASRADVWALLSEGVYRVDIGNGEEAVGVMWAYASPPIVQISDSAESGARAATIRAIDNINAWLPWNRHITVTDVDGQLVDAFREALARYRRLGDEFSRMGPLPSSDPLVVAYIRAGDAVDAAHVAAFGSNYFGESSGRFVAANLEGDLDGAAGTGGFGRITIDEDYNQSVKVIQHELLHALGMGGDRTCLELQACANQADTVLYVHVPVSRFPESAMAYASPYFQEHGLSQIDGETIQTIYTKLLGIGRDAAPYALVIGPGDISFGSLGPWDDSVVRIEGRFDRNPTLASYTGLRIKPAFGVDWRNGIARPWANGWAAFGSLQSSGLTGTATWTGDIVGFTPAQEAVQGDSMLSVDIADLSGNAAFTALEHWSGGAAPGARGTGTQWNDGDLHYSFALDSGGTYLRSNGGDEGYVSGRFVGDYSEAVVGILERPDLTAAFGAKRE